MGRTTLLHADHGNMGNESKLAVGARQICGCLPLRRADAPSQLGDLADAIAEQ